MRQIGGMVAGRDPSVEHDLTLQEADRLVQSGRGAAKQLRRTQLIIASGLLVASTAATVSFILITHL
jgi:hypothetical protein